EAIDFSHTSATYPQLFPKVLSFCYKLLGDIELQLPVKGLLIVFPFTILNAWAISHKKFNLRQMISYGLLLIFVVFLVNLKQFFNDGYADPVMTAALVLSCAYFFKSLKPSIEQNTYLILTVACALIATASKQPALLWSLFALPS